MTPARAPSSQSSAAVPSVDGRGGTQGAPPDGPSGVLPPRLRRGERRERLADALAVAVAPHARAVGAACRPSRSRISIPSAIKTRLLSPLVGIFFVEDLLERAVTVAARGRRRRREFTGLRLDQVFLVELLEPAVGWTRSSLHLVLEALRASARRPWPGAGSRRRGSIPCLASTNASARLVARGSPPNSSPLSLARPVTTPRRALAVRSDLIGVGVAEHPAADAVLWPASRHPASRQDPQPGCATQRAPPRRPARLAATPHGVADEPFARSVGDAQRLPSPSGMLRLVPSRVILANAMEQRKRLSAPIPRLALQNRRSCRRVWRERGLLRL